MARPPQDEEIPAVDYEWDSQPSDEDDDRPLNESPTNDHHVDGRCQIPAIDQNYQDLVDEAAKHLTALDLDLKVEKEEAAAAIDWLTKNAGAVGFFLADAPVRFTTKGTAPGSDHRGMYRPPTSSDDAHTDRVLLHSRLMSIIINNATWKAATNYPALRATFDRIADAIRKSYLDHLERRFTESKNPAYAWHAIRIILGKRLPIPEWLHDYLSNCAEIIYQAGEDRTPVSQTLIAKALGFAREHDGRMVGPVSEVRDDERRAMAYKLASIGIGTKKESITNEISKKERISESCARNYINEMPGRIRTPNPNGQSE